MGSTSHKILDITLVSAGAVGKNRLVTFGGAQCGAGARARGVSQYAHAGAGEAMTVRILGTSLVETGGAFDAGVDLQSDAQGRAVVLTTGERIGVSIEASTGAGQLIEHQPAIGESSDASATAAIAAATSDTGGGAGNAGKLVELDGDGKLDGRDVGADGIVTDASAAAIAAATTDTGAGAGNAGKLVELDGNGKLDGRDVGADGTKLDTFAAQGEYTRRDGSVPFTQPIAGVTPTQASHLTTKGYTDGLFAGFAWKDDVIAANLVDPPGAPNAGDRYIVDVGGINAWAGHDREIATWNGAAWTFEVPTANTFTLDQNTGEMLRFDGVNWVNFDPLNDLIAGAGLEKTGATLNIGAGPGIIVNPNTIEVDSVTDTGAGAGNAGKILELDGDGKADGRDIGADGIVTDASAAAIAAATTDTGAGAGNAGKLVELDGDGKLDGRDVGTDGTALDGLTTGANKAIRDSDFAANAKRTLMLRNAGGGGYSEAVFHSAAAAPATTDNTAAGYPDGSLWHDTQSGIQWFKAAENGGTASWKISAQAGTRVVLLDNQAGVDVGSGMSWNPAQVKAIVFRFTVTLGATKRRAGHLDILLGANAAGSSVTERATNLNDVGTTWALADDGAGNIKLTYTTLADGDGNRTAIFEQDIRG